MTNPLFNMIGQINPQQMLMNMLQQQNPQAFNQVQNLMNSGRNPQMLLQELTKNLSSQQIQQLKDVASKYGIK